MPICPFLIVSQFASACDKKHRNGKSQKNSASLFLPFRGKSKCRRGIPKSLHRAKVAERPRKSRIARLRVLDAVSFFCRSEARC